MKATVNVDYEDFNKIKQQSDNYEKIMHLLNQLPIKKDDTYNPRGTVEPYLFVDSNRPEAQKILKQLYKYQYNIGKLLDEHYDKGTPDEVPF